MKVVIIGGVAGGASTATRLRRVDETAQIVMFDRGDYVSYANCGLPYYIGGAISERKKLFVQTANNFSNQFNVDVRLNAEVTDIDLKAKKVTVRTAEKTYEESYDKLVVSTGAEPIKPPFPGINDPRIFSLRNVDDTDKIKDYIDAKKPKRAVVIGGGFIGLEMAENLTEAGVETCVVDIADQVMVPLDFTMAAIVHRHLKQKKVGLMLQEEVTGFAPQGDKLKVLLKSQKELAADMVVLSIGVRPEAALAKKAGLALGLLGGITVDEYMQTSDSSVYALGDVVEVFNPVIQKHVLIPLAGPANKQARIVADNLAFGNQYKYSGTIGTSVAKVFDLTVAAAGVNSKVLDREKIPYITSFTHPNSHATYYPGAKPISIAIHFSPKDGRLLGAQVVGQAGADKRLDLLAQVIKNGGTIYDLQEIEHAYAPPYSAAKDPVNMAGFVAENILHGKVKVIHWWQLKDLNPETSQLIDVRTPGEVSAGLIPGAINIPIGELRKRLDEVPKNKKLVLNCGVGLRSYNAARMLILNGFENVYNLSGGYTTYAAVTKKQSSDKPFASD